MIVDKTVKEFVKMINNMPKYFFNAAIYKKSLGITRFKVLKK